MNPSSTMHIVLGPDTLLTVAVANERDMRRVLDFVSDAAWVDGYSVGALLSFEVGPDVLCQPHPVNTLLGEQIWCLVRDVVKDVAPLVEPERMAGSEEEVAA